MPLPPPTPSLPPWSADCAPCSLDGKTKTPAVGLCNGVPVCASCVGILVGDLYGLPRESAQALYNPAAVAGGGTSQVGCPGGIIYVGGGGKGGGSVHATNFLVGNTFVRTGPPSGSWVGAGGAALPAGMASVAGDRVYRPQCQNEGLKVGEVRAYRCWKYQDGLLWSMSAHEVWAPGEAMTGKVSPSGDYGIHAFKLKRNSLKYSGADRSSTVFGEVLLWGEICEHELGYRAEYGRIAALDRPSWMSGAQYAALQEVYGLGRAPPVPAVQAVWAPARPSAPAAVASRFLWQQCVVVALCSAVIGLNVMHLVLR